MSSYRVHAMMRRLASYLPEVRVTWKGLNVLLQVGGDAFRHVG